jgi:hypothetical protein
MESSRRLPVIQPGSGEGAPPLFDKLAVVGLGLIGGSIALAARELWPTCLVIGVDNKDVLERAMVRHAIDVAADDPVVMGEADLVVLAAPVEQNIELLGELEHNISGEAIVTDVSSTKRRIVEQSRCLPPRLRFIGGHPLGGAPQPGIDYARPDLFKGRPWLFTPTDDSAGPTLERQVTAESNTRATTSGSFTFSRSVWSSVIKASSAAVISSALVEQISRQIVAGLAASRVVSASPRPVSARPSAPACSPTTCMRVDAAS